MSKKRTLPGVDEKALAELAKQFPRTETQTPGGQEHGEPEKAAAAPPVPPPSDPASAAASAAPAKKTTPPAATSGDKTDSKASAKPGAKATAKPGGNSPVRPAPKASSEASPAKIMPPAPKTRGRGLAVLAILISLCAVALSLAILAPPQLRPWLQERIKDDRIVDFLTGARFTLENRLGKTDASLDTLSRQVGDVAVRIEAIEAVGGANEAAARRVQAVEAAISTVNDKIASGIASGDERIEGIDGALAAAMGRVIELEQRRDADGARTEARFDALANGLEALATTTAPRLDALEQALRKLEGQATGSQKMFLIALKIRLAMQTSSPFAKEVSAAQALDGNSKDVTAALEQLAKTAATGASTVAQLSARFNERLAPRLLNLDQPPRSIVGRVGHWVDELLTSPGGGPTGAGSAAEVVDLARENLSRGDLSTAMERLGQLKGMAAVVLAEWMKDGRRRLAMDEAAAVLMTHSFDRLIGGK